MPGRIKNAPVSSAEAKPQTRTLRLKVRNAMDEIMEDKEGPAAARVAAARLLFDAGYLEEGASAGPPAEQASLPELDAEIARLEADVGKA